MQGCSAHGTWPFLMLLYLPGCLVLPVVRQLSSEGSTAHLIVLGAIKTQGLSPEKAVQNLSELGQQWTLDGEKKNSSDCRIWDDINLHPWGL